MFICFPNNNPMPRPLKIDRLILYHLVRLTNFYILSVPKIHQILFPVKSNLNDHKTHFFLTIFTKKDLIIMVFIHLISNSQPDFKKAIYGLVDECRYLRQSSFFKQILPRTPSWQKQNPCESV